MKSLNMDRAATYQIKVEGKLDQNWSDWFSGLTITVADESEGRAITTMTGAVDQSALRGILTKIWDVNLTLISIARLDVLNRDEGAET